MGNRLTIIQQSVKDVVSSPAGGAYQCEWILAYGCEQDRTVVKHAKFEAH